jgi:hypothetical protein
MILFSLFTSLIHSFADPVMVTLPTLTIQPGYSVSGLSSGAFFAAQYEVCESGVLDAHSRLRTQVIFSSEVVGAAVIAGGMYYCTEGDETRVPVCGEGDARSLGCVLQRSAFVRVCA